MGRQRRDSIRKPQYSVPESFSGFGPSILDDVARRPLQHKCFPTELPAARQAIRRDVPMCPGVYGWLNHDDSLIYVGKSKALRHRLTSYFATQTTDPKMARIRRESKTLVWEPISHDLLSLIREQELIDRWRPPYNVQGKPERQQPGFVCVSNGIAPSITFAGQVQKRVAESFGPIAGRRRLAEAITSLNYVFQIRDCPDKTKMEFSNQLTLFGNDQTAQCLRYELNSCLAPCAANCSREVYRHNIDKASNFLKGKDKATLDRLKERMDRAAEQMSFERACVMRDQWRNLKWLSGRLIQLRRAQRKLDGVWVLPGFDQREHWLLMRKGQLLDCVAGPEKIPNSVVTDEITRTIDQVRTARISAPSTNLETNQLLLLSSWLRKFPDTAGSIMKFKEAAGRLSHPVENQL